MSKYSKEFAEYQLRSLYTIGSGYAFLKPEGTPLHPSDPMVSNVELQTKAFEDFWNRVLNQEEQDNMADYITKSLKDLSDLNPEYIIKIKRSGHPEIPNSVDYDTLTPHKNNGKVLIFNPTD